jgi:hypothetical protein
MGRAVETTSIAVWPFFKVKFRSVAHLLGVYREFMEMQPAPIAMVGRQRSIRGAAAGQRFIQVAARSAQAAQGSGEAVEIEVDDRRRVQC